MWKKGFIIIPKNREQEFEILNQNFDNLLNNYENLFGGRFGNIPVNPKRGEVMKKLLGTPPSEAYFLIKFIAETEFIPGDICEFGVAQGITSQLIATEIQDSEKKFHLFDSFEGLPKPTAGDTLKNDIFHLGSIEAYTGTMSVPEFSVINKLKKINFPKERYHIHKGFIEELINKRENFPNSVSFAYVDFDFYEPIKIALNFLDQVMQLGSIIVVDDYDFFSTGAKKAVDEFVDLHKTEYDLTIPDKGFGHFAILKKN